MTSTESATSQGGTGASNGHRASSETPETVTPTRRFEAGAAGEILLAAEVAALTAFAFSRPVLDSFGRSPETFVARGAGAMTVVLFGLVVALVPVAVVAAIGLVARVLGTTVRWWTHVALVAVIGGLALWRIGQDVTGWPGEATKLILLGLVGGPALAYLRLKVPVSRSFLRYVGLASVFFLVQFMFMSPASSLIGGGTAGGVDDDATRVVADALGDDPPPIVFIITDTFPTQALMDGSGNIDAELYPNLSALAATSTWYRNSTTVSAFTNEAVPAMLSGRYPKPSTRQQFVVPYPDNLFSLFGGVYDLHVHEPMTRLCPTELCERRSGGIGPLLGDAVDLWWGGTKPARPKLDIPGLFLADRYDDFAAWIDAQDFRQSGRPDLFFYHAMLPHEPWHFLPDGSVYEASDPPVGVSGVGWVDDGARVGHQRVVMQAQATDRLLGRLFDRMRADGSFDDALIVVAGDHGQSFTPGEPWRAVSEGNHDEVLWAPLIMKAPHQSAGEVNDDNVETVDILATMAARLGFELPFRTDGIPAGAGEPRDPDVKHFDDVSANELRAEDGESLVSIDPREGFEALLRADAAEGTGPDAVWQRTAHGALVGQDVDGLDVADEGVGTVAVDGLDRFDDVDADEPLPLEVVGFTGGPPGTVVAFAVNGTIAAITEAEDPTLLGHRAHALLLPRTLTDGANELTAYLVDGPVGAETLRPLRVEPTGR